MSILRTVIVFSCVLLIAAHPSNYDEDIHMHPFDDGDDLPKEMKFDLAEEQSAEFWNNIGKTIVKKNVDTVVNKNKAKNVIFFLGDGLSVPTLMAARTYLGQLEGKPGEETELSFEKFPVVGLTKTYCVDRQVPDSACTATAYLCGVKGNYNTVGVTAKVPRSSCEQMKNTENHVDSIIKKAIDNGLSAGIVTTTRVTHASPAGAYAHSAHREWESDSYIVNQGFNITECPDIAHQLVHHSPGNAFKVILGGGRREFRPDNHTDEEGSRGYRTDNRDLIEEWKQSKLDRNQTMQYVWNRDQLLNISQDTDYLLGLFEASHCQYHLAANNETEPTFEEMVETAIKILSKDDKGYILFAEGGRIDHAHHSNYAYLSLDETVEFAKAIERAVEMTDSDETLIIVTADHSHNFAISGYPSRGNPILGAVDRNIGSDGIPYTTLSYANGQGYRPEVDGKRVDVTKENMNSRSFRYPAMVPLSSETHGGDDVPVFAYGPHQHLFTGLYEQNVIPHIISYAACYDNKFSACNSSEILKFSNRIAFYMLLLIGFVWSGIMK